MSFSPKLLNADPANTLQLTMSALCLRLERAKLTMMHPKTMRTTRTRLQKYQEEKRCGDSGAACLKQQECPQQYWSAIRHLSWVVGR